MIGKNFKRGSFVPKNPEKYLGNVANITYRSSWELHVMIFLDTNPSILNWSSETIAIPYFSKIDNRPHRYFPDFYMKYIDKCGITVEELVEVKPAAETQPPIKKRGKRQTTYLREIMEFEKNIAKWAAASDYTKKRSWRFRILTEDEIFGR